MYSKEIQITAEKLNDQTLFTFIDTFHLDEYKMVFSEEVKKLGVASYSDFTKFIFLETEKHWNSNSEKTQALKILRNSEYKAGFPATVAHNMEWKSAFYDETRGVLSFKAHFDCYPSFPSGELDSRGNVARDFGGDMNIYCADMRFEGVQDLKVVKRVFDWGSFKEVQTKETSWRTLQKIFLRKDYVFVPNIKETAEGVVITFQMKFVRGTKKITFLELSFQYDKSYSSLESVEDKSFLHWETNFYRIYPQYFKWNNQKFKKRKHHAKKKMKTYKMLKEDGLLN